MLIDLRGLLEQDVETCLSSSALGQEGRAPQPGMLPFWVSIQGSGKVKDGVNHERIGSIQAPLSKAGGHDAVAS